MARSRALRANGDSDNMSSYERVAAGEKADRRGRAGTQFDDVYRASRTGDIGYGTTYHLRPRKD